MSDFAGHDLTCVRGERTVFAGLGFTLPAGGAVVLVGPNGSGKSSLLRLMAGLLRPARGRLTWGGEAISEDPEAHGGRLHYVGHLDAVKPVLTVAENLAFWAGLHGPGNADRKLVLDALERFGLDHLADVPGQMLSAGERRRLSLARLVAVPAALWLLDEPTAVLDKVSVAALEGVLAEQRAGGGMVAVATHGALGLDGAAELRLLDYAVDPRPAGLPEWYGGQAGASGP